MSIRESADDKSFAAGSGQIEVIEHGPYRVTGNVPLRESIIAHSQDANVYRDGRVFPHQEQYLLCRCGHSSTMPFCDGAHQHIHFDGRLTASREPFEEQAEHLTGQSLVLSDAPRLCALARFCHRGQGDVWSFTQASGSPYAREQAIKAAIECPAGRLVAHDRRTGEAIEPQYEEQSIVLLQDPSRQCSGPLWVRGGIPIKAPDGTFYELRNRMTLCRCGASRNKPFCDATHVATGFSDRKEQYTSRE